MNLVDIMLSEIVSMLSCFSCVQLCATPCAPGKNTRVGCHDLLQGTFLTQGSNLHWQGVLYHWHHLDTKKMNILCFYLKCSE